MDISEEQRKKLQKLWFIYGNDGKKHTHYNHRFIQNIIEHNEDTRDAYINSARLKTLKPELLPTVVLTQECMDLVDEVLNGNG
jgi:acetyl esterase/lipase